MLVAVRTGKAFWFVHQKSQRFLSEGLNPFPVQLDNVLVRINPNAKACNLSVDRNFGIADHLFPFSSRANSAIRQKLLQFWFS